MSTYYMFAGVSFEPSKLKRMGCVRYESLVDFVFPKSTRTLSDVVLALNSSIHLTMKHCRNFVDRKVHEWKRMRSQVSQTDTRSQKTHLSDR
jgi:hypothetical protein